MRNAEAGITLIEVLVVLAVIGIAAGAALIGTTDRGRTAETEAIRLARHIMLGVDEAFLTGLPLAVQGDERGYRFAQLNAAEASRTETSPTDWPAASLPALGSRHTLAAPLELRLADGSPPFSVVLPASGATALVTFQIVGAIPEWTVTFDGFTAFAQVKGGT